MGDRFGEGCPCGGGREAGGLCVFAIPSWADVQGAAETPTGVGDPEDTGACWWGGGSTSPPGRAVFTWRRLTKQGERTGSPPCCAEPVLRAQAWCAVGSCGCPARPCGGGEHGDELPQLARDADWKGGGTVEWACDRERD